jgi:hypothetical protein
MQARMPSYPMQLPGKADRKADSGLRSPNGGLKKQKRVSPTANAPKGASSVAFHSIRKAVLLIITPKKLG